MRKRIVDSGHRVKILISVKIFIIKYIRFVL